MENLFRAFTKSRSVNGQKLTTAPVTIGIVIARYNENLYYLDDIRQFLKGYTVNFHIYNKGPTPIPKPCIVLENVGVCDHTYLYHIITHYDNLDDITIFLPGSCSSLRKRTLTRNLLSEAFKYEYKFTFVTNDPRLSEFKIDKYTCTDAKINKLDT